MNRKWLDFLPGARSHSEEGAEQSATRIPSCAEAVAVVHNEPESVESRTRRPVATLSNRPGGAELSQSPIELTAISTIYEECKPRNDCRFSALKICNMLGSAYVRDMSLEFKRNAILLALEASGTNPQDVINDAIVRIRALEEREREAAKRVEEFERKKQEENLRLNRELGTISQEYRTRIQVNNEEVTRQIAAFLSWRVQISEEIQKITDGMACFTSDLGNADEQKTPKKTADQK